MPALDSFRAARWIRTINLVAQAVLFLTFFLGLNYLVRNQPLRFDLTRHRSFSLSPESLSYVNNLKQPVEIYVTLANDEDYPEVRGILREYQTNTEASDAGKISVKYLDVYQDHRTAETLGIEQSDVLVFRCGGKTRVLPVGELYRMETKAGATERKEFLGEQVLTAAILDVSRPVRKKIYFLVGHTELNPGDVDPNHGLSAARDTLALRNFQVDTLELAVSRKIPEDTSLLIAVSPLSRFTPSEQELLREYLGNGAGRLILFLSPGVAVTTLGLDDLLLDWGVLVDDVLVCDTGPENMTEDGDLLVRAFSDHPITKNLISYNVPLRAGPARTVRPDPGRPVGSGLTTVALAATSTTAWGEAAYRLGQLRYDHAGNIHPIPGIEPKGRLGLAVASERVAVRNNLLFSVPGGRLVVFGTGDLISNHRLANGGNQSIFLGAVNWTVENDTQLAIPPRPIERFQLSLSAADLRNLRYALLLALPGITALLGLGVYWARRS